MHHRQHQASRERSAGQCSAPAACQTQHGRKEGPALCNRQRRHFHRRLCRGASAACQPVCRRMLLATTRQLGKQKHACSYAITCASSLVTSWCWLHRSPNSMASGRGEGTARSFRCSALCASKRSDGALAGTDRAAWPPGCSSSCQRTQQTTRTRRAKASGACWRRSRAGRTRETSHWTRHASPPSAWAPRCAGRTLTRVRRSNSPLLRNELWAFSPRAAARAGPSLETSTTGPPARSPSCWSVCSTYGAVLYVLILQVRASSSSSVT